jgi:hypothetical protein
MRSQPDWGGLYVMEMPLSNEPKRKRTEAHFTAWAARIQGITQA